MKPLAFTVGLGLLVVWGCSPGPAERGHGVRVDVVARGLVTPWSIAVAPDGRLFVAERPGRIRVVAHDTLVQRPWATVPAFDATDRRWETGLMGLALHPDFDRSPFVFVCYTYQTEPGVIFNRVARLVERDGRGEELTMLVDSIPAGNYHDGCRVKVGPDRKLYVTTGDAYDNVNAQDRSSLAGKVLRLNLDGSIPHDNPQPSSPIWSLGHRNPQGIVWDTESGVALVTEHGGGTIDEINVLERDANYGWPNVNGRAIDSAYRDSTYHDPVFVFHAAPSGAAMLSRTVFPGGRAMLVATLHGERLIRFAVRGTSVSIADDSLLVGFGRLRDVVEAPDGSVYVTSSNRDGRGRPRRGDDRVLRLRFVR
jgi:glucose/arabinose dehydrogenase